ncbi:Nif3p [Sugiyamaella lignohabitans]|uniref:Nif3p n=1 Tax=Sugiyamaella lignohabitans TaxID=796027 RepID=A0A167FL28_9ASCO|nr:Nif3p [Sugiyamaella lignohabitans]ANB15434.1 Nif3p [Sugiyamaella lignohabitans]
MVIAYHPFIFRGLKQISPKDSQQESLLRLVRAGISVYCPHTAIDAGVGGVNDWLADGVSGGSENEVSRTVVQQVKIPEHLSEDHSGAGYGRVVELSDPVPLTDLVSRIKNHLGLKHVQLAANEAHLKGKLVKTVAICAGSGESVLQGVKADVHFTGELGHHYALHLIENGSSAIVCGHSNTERGFLSTFKKQLLEDFVQNYANDYDEFDIAISSSDKDPLVTV